MPKWNTPHTCSECALAVVEYDLPLIDDEEVCVEVRQCTQDMMIYPLDAPACPLFEEKEAKTPPFTCGDYR